MRKTSGGVSFVDASTSERLLINLLRIRLAFPLPDTDTEDILSDLLQTLPSFDLVLVIIPSDIVQERALRKAILAANRYETVVTPSGAEMTNMLLSAQPLTAFAQTLSLQVAPSRLSAYQRGGGVSRAGAFFGRHRELANILNRELANYFLVGGRQVGKTSLLKEIKRQLDSRGDIGAYVALINEDIRGPLGEALELPTGATLAKVYQHLIKSGPRRKYILIDEADQFVRHEVQTGYQNLAMFRRLSEEGRAFFIIAGYWDLYRTIVFDYRSPLRNFGEQMRLGTLDESACARLATEPMTALNLHYESPDLITRIYRATAGRANLMTTVCDQLIKQRPDKDRTISADLVQRVLHGFEIRSQLEGWDDLSSSDSEGLKANRLDRITVYCTVSEDEFALAALQRKIATLGLNFTGSDLLQSLARLTLAVVVDNDGNKKYRYCIPLFVELLREYDLPDALAAIMAETDTSSATSH
jgi:hypothetical protein